MRQKCEYQNGGNKKTKHQIFRKNEHLPPDIVKNIRFFSENLECFIFLLPPF